MEGLIRAFMAAGTSAALAPSSLSAPSILRHALRSFSVLAQTSNSQALLQGGGRVQKDPMKCCTREKSNTTMADGASVSSAWRQPGEASTSQGQEHGPVKPHLVEQFLSTHNMRPGEAAKAEKPGIMRQFQRHSGDVGSPAVTIALWTHDIRRKAAYFHEHPKDLMNMRRLEMQVHQRRRLLAWLRNTDFPAYALCISQLGLNDVYGTSHHGDRYHVGVPHGQKAPAPTQDAVRRRRFAFHRQYKTKKTSHWKRLLPMLEAEDPLLPKPKASMAPGSVQQLLPEA